MLSLAKIVVGFLAGSLAVLGDGVDSATDVIISVVMIFAAKIVSKPPTKKYAYGYEKAETIATIVKPGEEGQDDAIEDGCETGQSQGQEEREKVDLSKEGEGSDGVVLEDVIDGKYRDDKDDQDFDDVFAGLLFHQSLWMTSFILRRISSAPRIFSVS